MVLEPVELVPVTAGAVEVVLLAPDAGVVLELVLQAMAKGSAKLAIASMVKVRRMAVPRWLPDVSTHRAQREFVAAEHFQIGSNLFRRPGFAARNAHLSWQARRLP